MTIKPQAPLMPIPMPTSMPIPMPTSAPPRSPTPPAPSGFDALQTAAAIARLRARPAPQEPAPQERALLRDPPCDPRSDPPSNPSHAPASLPATPESLARGLSNVPLADAYAAQFAVERLLVETYGFQSIGWKVGATNAVARVGLGLDGPFLGRLYRQMTFAAPTQIPFRAGLHRAYEAEIALHLGCDLPERGAPYDAAAVQAATRAVAPAIEIVGAVLPPMDAGMGAGALIADLAGHGAWILGPARRDFAALDLLAMPIRLSVNGVERARGCGAQVDGGPFASAAWLANTLIGMGRPLQAGAYITTGATLAPQPVAAGHIIKADFGPLGQIDLVMG